MKISNIFQATNIFKTNSKLKTQKKFNNKSIDNIKISSEAIDFQNALKAINKTPDVRQDKIDDISKKIQNGDYFVPSEKIADKIFQN